MKLNTLPEAITAISQLPSSILLGSKPISHPLFDFAVERFIN